MKFFFDFLSKYKVYLVLTVVIIVAVFFTIYNPYKQSFFPKCSFYVYTGYKCPGCGSQRAIYNIVHLHFLDAVKENFALVLFIPFFIIAFLVDFLKIKLNFLSKIYNVMFSFIAIWTIFFFIIFYWILRNLPIYNNLLSKL